MSSISLSALMRPFTTKQGLALILPALGLLALLASVGSASFDTGETTDVVAAAAAGTQMVAATQPTKLAARDAGFSPKQTKAIELIIRDYLITNPEVMLDVQRALQIKTDKLEAERQKVAIMTNAKDLFHRPNSAVAGNPNGDVTLVEFFDYNCGYCKRAFADVAKLIDKDKKLRVVFKELPILSRGSEEAARVALAARLQGKYWQVHQALLKSPGRANKASALKVAQKLGLDIAKLEKDMTSPVVDKEISETKILAQKMGINGTPHFLIGDKAVPGAPENLLGLLAAHVRDIRKNGCPVC